MIFTDFNRKTFLYGYQNEALMTKHASLVVLPPHLYIQKADFLSTYGKMIIQKITEQQTDLIRNGLENTIKTM